MARWLTRVNLVLDDKIYIISINLAWILIRVLIAYCTLSAHPGLRMIRTNFNLGYKGGSGMVKAQANGTSGRFERKRYGTRAFWSD